MNYMFQRDYRMITATRRLNQLSAQSFSYKYRQCLRSKRQALLLRGGGKQRFGPSFTQVQFEEGA